MVLLPILVFARRARLERAIEQTESLLEEKGIQQTNTLAVLQHNNFDKLVAVFFIGGY